MALSGCVSVFTIAWNASFARHVGAELLGRVWRVRHVWRSLSLSSLRLGLRLFP